MPRNMLRKHGKQVQGHRKPPQLAPAGSLARQARGTMRKRAHQSPGSADRAAPAQAVVIAEMRSQVNTHRIWHGGDKVTLQCEIAVVVKADH